MCTGPDSFDNILQEQRIPCECETERTANSTNPLAITFIVPVSAPLFEFIGSEGLYTTCLLGCYIATAKPICIILMLYSMHVIFFSYDNHVT